MISRARVSRAFTLFALLALLPSCSAPSEPDLPETPPESGETLTVTATAQDTFTPSLSTVGVGTRVTFVNGGGTHNVHMSGLTGLRCAVSCDGAGNGDPSSQLWSFSFVLANPGTLDFVCDEHPTQTGQIIVQ